MNKLEEEYNNILINFGLYSLFFIIIPIIFGIKKYRTLNKALVYILLFIVFEAIIELFLQGLIWISSTYLNLWLSIADLLNIDSTNFLSIFAYTNRFIILGFYFYEVLQNRQKAKLVLYASWLLMTIVTYDYFFITGHNNYSSFSQALLSFYGLLMALLHLKYLYTENNKVPLNKNPYFWISMGLLFPNIMTIWLELFGSYLQEADFILYCQVSICYIVFYCIGMLLIARGFYFSRYAKYLPRNN